jgi:SAM-dependent methyltransferase
MAIRKVVKEDGTTEEIKLKRFHTPTNSKKVEWGFRKVVKLTDSNYTVNADGVGVYDTEPGVESGLDDDGLLFNRVGRFMQVGIEHFFRYIHLYRQVPANSVVLDAACGYGELGKLLYTERAACTYVGMDIAGKKLKVASKLGWGSSKTMFIQRDLSRKLPFKKKTFDVAVSTEFIEHVKKPHAEHFLKELCRVIKPNGKLVLTTPNNEWGEVDPVHPQEYGYQETIDMVEKAGFEIIDTFGLKLRGNVREWDKAEKGETEEWKAMRKAYPPIWAKCFLAANEPENSVFWSLVARRKPKKKTKKKAVNE